MKVAFLSQVIVVTYLFIILIGAPLIRSVMMMSGAKDFVSWGEYLKIKAPVIIEKIVIAAILCCGML